MKILSLLFVAALLAGCAGQGQREASCKCFTSDGKASGLCKFTSVPAEPATY